MLYVVRKLGTFCALPKAMREVTAMLIKIATKSLVT